MAIKTNAKEIDVQTVVPTKTQFAVLELIQLLPCFVVWGILNTTHDGIVTLLAFFLVLLGAPLAYCQYYDIDLRVMILSGLHNRKSQVIQGTLAAIGIISIMVGAYFAFWNAHLANQAFILTLNIPLRRTFSVCVTFFIIFSFVNPVLEEFFWRVFLAKNMVKNELYNMWVSVHYALYHVFVIQYIVQDWLVAGVVMIGLIGLGRFFAYLRDQKGIIVSILAHLGADMGIAIFYSHVFSQYTA